MNTLTNYYSRNALVSNIDIKNKNEVYITATMLTNKEYCTACAEGRGCGAIYLNDLTPLAKKRKEVKVTINEEILQRDNLSINDIISLQTKVSSYYLLVIVFYLVPASIFIICLYLLKLFNISELLIALITISIITCYFFITKLLLSKSKVIIKYQGIVQKYIPQSSSSAQIKELK